MTDSSGSSGNQNVKIVVQDGNARPSAITPTPTLVVAENTNMHSLVAAVNQLFTDGTQADPMVLFITSVSSIVNPAIPQSGQSRDNLGSGVGFFADETKELAALTTQGVLDFERFHQFQLFITCKDWPVRNIPSRNFLSKTQNGEFTVIVTDVNESPFFVNGMDSTGTPVTQQLFVLENSASGTLVGDIEVSGKPYCSYRTKT